ncbi:DUF2946 domain-containing protein [Paraburkholderia sp. J12]|uniref:DUF2946 domain-containing protein n=1 Tax=Paraburkholderia sp. J12 TaxID=2805432 RepID=UPI002ABD6E2A|nr:DUF2946 domain-containing protein [Paraburkholderia sp. J12]
MARIRLLKLGSLLGLLAILMSTLAPTVSQTLAAHHRLGNALATYCTVEPGAANPAQDGGNHSLAQHWQACPYCSLLAHVPVLPGATLSFAVALAVTRASAAPVRHAVRALVAHTAAQPRAPPSLS